MFQTGLVRAATPRCTALVTHVYVKRAINKLKQKTTAQIIEIVNMKKMKTG